jgi:5-methylcytosine-specific restriction endonuclease McrA
VVTPRRDEVDPLTAELSRLSTTVSRRFLAKLKTAREGLGHAIPGATTEQVLEAALDLLLEKQAKARGLVKRPRSVAPSTTSTTTSTPTSTPTEPPPRRRDGPRAAIPAAVRRAVWQRDGGRCQWPADGGGSCGSTHRLELDHIVPWADWGGETAGNLRVVCAAHNRLAARQRFGERCVRRYAGGGA